MAGAAFDTVTAAVARMQPHTWLQLLLWLLHVGRLAVQPLLTYAALGYAPWPDSCSLPAAGSGSASIILCGMLLRVQSLTRLVCVNCTHLALHQHQQARCMHMAPMFGGLPLRVVTHGDVGSMSCTLQHNWHCLQVWVSLWLSQAVRPVDESTGRRRVDSSASYRTMRGARRCIRDKQM